jgi:uncharacterized protein DUF3168
VSLAVRRGLYGKLAGDTTLNNLLASAPSGYSKSIFYEQAPATATFPYVLFSKSAGTPTYAFGGSKAALDEDVWLVKGIDRNTTADIADAIADRLNSLLTDAALSISGANHKYLRRMSDVTYPEVTDGVQYRHAGALYRLITEPT